LTEILEKKKNTISCVVTQVMSAGTEARPVFELDGSLGKK
jgi:hypothetical protein